MPRSTLFWSVFDVAGKQQRVAVLAKQASAPDFWNDSQLAQKTIREMNALRAEIEGWTSLAHRAQDALDWIDLAEADAALADGVTEEVASIRREFEANEFRLLLSGRHDRDDAIVAIHAGAGGVDAADWAAMLLRMYVRWAETRGFKTDLLDQLAGDEAGLRSVTISVAGEHAYGYLRAEKGVHRLVRLSPFDSAHRRHTSFALVEVWPDLPDDSEIDINPNDLRIDTYRASSAGGQHVQKNATAVRITHLPSGIVVACQNERSQTQNRETALKILRARLYELEAEKQREALAVLKGEHVKAEWGSQIRSYVLHPYQMVKDHRTDHEVGNAQAVLDGRLDDFMEAYLRSAFGTN